MDGFELSLDNDDFRQSPIHRAIVRGNHQKLLVALSRDLDVHLRDPDFTSTYLHVLVSHATSVHVNKYVTMVYQLANAGVDVYATDYKGR